MAYRTVSTNFLMVELNKIQIDEMYDYGIKKGALGGKLIGAGSEGFILFYVNKDKHKSFLRSFKKQNCVLLKRENHGARVFSIDN